MKTTVLQLLPSTTYGTPSGTYDGISANFNGERQQAANYYGGFGGLQTVAFYFNSFRGRVELQATLDSNPTADSDWFRVYDVDYTDSSTATANFSTNITGNFTWIRARVEQFTAGTISRITISY